MKRYIKILFATIGAISIMSSTALAGQWVENGGNWFYMTDDGNYAKNTWLWLDENHDTKAELYHFDTNGVMARSTVIQVGSGNDYMLVNIDDNGAAIGCTFVEDSTIDNLTFCDYRFPTSYSVKLDSNGSYVYSLDVDHYDFKEIKDAEFNDYLNDCPIKKSNDCYSAEISLSVFHGGTFACLQCFNCSIKTTAKFAKNCKVRLYDNEEVISISDYLKKNDMYSNWLEVYSVDDDGYITDCMIYGAG
ncbi:hypothetical protein [Oribacterium sp. P6A1]|uniref:hypothetical protein n=1 Tax=Oribacterium sp. P6A1 TaxID=1410612 RepID=UPI00055E097D|nr:hypothetical protein [Oribacterium sp. P6A1]